ncbi:outer membrane porin, OprD family, partial [Acinetobacter baumannii]
MEFIHRFKPCNLAITTLFGLLTSSSLWAADTTQQSEDEWKFTLKNAYINRNFDNDALKDTGSWSQAASLFYKSKMHDTPLIIADKPITIGADASVQYAVRLSSDKHVADTVLP